MNFITNIYYIYMLNIMHKEKIYTFVRLIMTGNIVAGKNNGGYKYGGTAEKPPNLTATILPVI